MVKERAGPNDAVPWSAAYVPKVVKDARGITPSCKLRKLLLSVDVSNSVTYLNQTDTYDMRYGAMIGEKRQLVTDEPVEFNK